MNKEKYRMSRQRDYFIVPSLRIYFNNLHVLDRTAEEEDFEEIEQYSPTSVVFPSKDLWISEQLSRAINLNTSQLYEIYDEFAFIAQYKSFEDMRKVPALDSLFIENYLLFSSEKLEPSNFYEREFNRLMKK